MNLLSMVLKFQLPYYYLASDGYVWLSSIKCPSVLSFNQ